MFIQIGFTADERTLQRKGHLSDTTALLPLATNTPASGHVPPQLHPQLRQPGKPENVKSVEWPT